MTSYVTYSDLIQIGILIVSIISLILQSKKKKYPPRPRFWLLLFTKPLRVNRLSACPGTFIIPERSQLSTGSVAFSGIFFHSREMAIPAKIMMTPRIFLLLGRSCKKMALNKKIQIKLVAVMQGNTDTGTQMSAT